MTQVENCPKTCNHETFHYCSDAGTHCDVHCICSCFACIEEKKNPGPINPEMGGRVLPGAAVVREVEGHIVLEDPNAVAMIQAVSKHNCRGTLEQNSDRVEHFKRRTSELGKTASQVVIVLLNVDDPHGGPLAEILMPSTNWQEFRDRGEVPFARGLARRDAIQEILGNFDEEAATKLQTMEGLAVVVVDHGVAEIFAA